jgi:hypothetical protein
MSLHGRVGVILIEGDSDGVLLLLGLDDGEVDGVFVGGEVEGAPDGDIEGEVDGFMVGATEGEGVLGDFFPDGFLVSPFDEPYAGGSDGWDSGVGMSTTALDGPNAGGCDGCGSGAVTTTVPPVPLPGLMRSSMVGELLGVIVRVPFGELWFPWHGT